MSSKKTKRERGRGAPDESLLELPRSQEAERVIGGALLVGSVGSHLVFAKLAPEDFFDSRLCVIYSRLRAMDDQCKTIDLPTAVDQLRAHGELEHAGGPAFVASLTDGLPHRFPLDSYVGAILETALLRRIANAGQRIVEAALKSTSARETLLAADKELSELRATLRLRGRNSGGESVGKILDQCAEFLRRFVVISPAQAIVVALWILHTHSLEATDVTGYLSITSAEKRSGKTRLLELCELLVAEPWLTGRVTSAVLVRKIDSMRPTLLLDESDTALRDHSEYSDILRGILNLGYRRSGVVSCCVGKAETLEFHDFSAFCPKAIAGIGSLPDTVEDRSFPIRLQRRAPHEQVEKFRRSEIEAEAILLRDHIAGCISKIFEALKLSRPESLAELGDRQNEIAAPLLAIADAAYGDWPERARSALREIFGDCCQEPNESLRVRLLRDIRSIFDEDDHHRIATTVLCERLNIDENAPWCEFTHGKPLTARGLARMLAPFRVRPGHFREGLKTIRGYTRASFSSVWDRYCPLLSAIAGTSGTSGTSNPSNGFAVPNQAIAQKASGQTKQPAQESC